MDIEQAHLGSVHGPKMLELKECWNTTLRCRVWVLNGPVWSQDSLVLVCPLPVRIFYESTIMFDSLVWFVLFVVVVVGLSVSICLFCLICLV